MPVYELYELFIKKQHSYSRKSIVWNAPTYEQCSPIVKLFEFNTGSYLSILIRFMIVDGVN